jgi:hypothetical protein
MKKNLLSNSGDHCIYFVAVTLIDLTGRELMKTQVIQQPTTLGDQLVAGIIFFASVRMDGQPSNEWLRNSIVKAIIGINGSMILSRFYSIDRF